MDQKVKVGSQGPIGATSKVPITAPSKHPELTTSRTNSNSEFDAPEFGIIARQHIPEVSERKAEAKNPNGVRSYPELNAARNDLKTTPSCGPLTTEALRHHNIQQAHIPPSPTSQYTLSLRPVNVLEDDIVSLDNIIYHMHSVHIEELTHKHNTSSLCNEVDHHSLKFESLHFPQSPLIFYQQSDMDFTSADTVDFDPLSQVTDNSQSPTAWGNVLAGIGEQFMDHIFPDNPEYDEFLVD